MANDRASDEKPEDRSAQIERRFEELQGRLKEAQLEALKNPGPTAEREQERVREELRELAAEIKQYIAGAVAHIEATEDKMREFWRIEIDLEKHLTTLSTASIIGLAALLQVSPFEARLGDRVAVSFGLLLITIIISVSTMSLAQVWLLDMPTRPLREEFDPPPRSWLVRNAADIFFELHWVLRVASSATFVIALALVAGAALKAS